MKRRPSEVGARRDGAGRGQTDGRIEVVREPHGVGEDGAVYVIVGVGVDIDPADQ